MLERKTLAFKKDGPEVKRPKVSKRLCFSSLALAIALSACSHADAPQHAQVGRPPIRESIMQREAQLRPEKSCGLSGEGWLHEGERMLGSICKEGTLFVLTDRSILIGDGEARMDPTYFSEMRVGGERTRTDVQEALGNGLVDWTASGDMAFILTSDRVLTLVPAGDVGEQLDTYNIPIDVSDAKMAHHGGFLFIAGKERLFAASFSGEWNWRNIPMRLDARDPDFFESGGKLFYGDGKRRVEIIIEGKGLDEVDVR